jgi:UDP-glucose 4-epimerase
MAAYLVTGGCGFIGSHLCEALIRRGADVRILDDLSTGSLANAPAGATVIRGDVADPQAVETAMTGITGCFHLAAVASVERSKKDWLGTHRTNLTGTIAVLDAARRLPRDRAIPVVYASSAAIYGSGHAVPTPETVPGRPLSPYGADKYGCELHAGVASRGYHVPTVGLRFFNVYGPRQDPHSSYSGVISIFCDRLRQGCPIDIYGDGSQTRDFVFVGDAVTALLAAMERASEDAAVFNVCSGTPTSVLELAAMIGKLCSCQPELHFRPPRSGEIAHSCGDRRRSRERLSLPDPMDLPTGLAATLAWMRTAEPARDRTGKPL